MLCLFLHMLSGTELAEICAKSQNVLVTSSSTISTHDIIHLFIEIYIFFDSTKSTNDDYR